MTKRFSALLLVALTFWSSMSVAGVLMEPAGAQSILPGRENPLPDGPGVDPGSVPVPDNYADDPENDGPFGILGNDTTPPHDPRDSTTEEWEQQVATDARGDVLLHYPGTTDLYYLTIGELFAWSLGEPYILVRVGYNMSTPSTADLSTPNNLPGPQVPDQFPAEPFVTINITFNISAERTITISLYTDTYGTTWFSNQGLLVADRGNVDGHREVLYLAPLRRFGLEEGDTLSDYNITSYRGTRLVDTMEAFDPLNDPLPRYLPVKALFDSTKSAAEELLPVEPPAPPAAPFPIPPPLPVGLPPNVPDPSTEPEDHLPDDTYPYPPELGPQGIPHALGTPNEWRDWTIRAATGQDQRPPVYADQLGPEGDDLERSAAYNITHDVTEGQSRFVARSEREIVAGDHSHFAYANFSVESLFEETDQRVLMLVVAPERTRWLMRYALDMPDGMKELPAGGRVDMGMVAVPTGLFAQPRWTAQVMFLSDWGGLDIVQVTFVSLLTDPRDFSGLEASNNLPDTLVVDLVNENDPFRVNEPRNVMVQVRDGYGRYVSGMDSVRAYVYPAGGRPPNQPYQLHEKPFMDGVYQIPFTFDRPGAWQVDVYFFDYDADAEGMFPTIRFVVRVDYPGESTPIIPIPAALGGVALVFAAISARERLAKTR